MPKRDVAPGDGSYRPSVPEHAVEQHRFGKLANRASMSQHISQLLKQAIIDGNLAPGQRIVESKVASDLDVSLSPVREAVRQLVGEGILTITPNRGPSVRILSEDDAFELYSLRAVFEGLAIRLAASRPMKERERVTAVFQEMVAALGDPEVPTLIDHSTRIHDGIVSLSKHERLIAMYQSLVLQITVLNRVAGRSSTKQREVDWHRPIVDALIEGDPDKAEAVIRTHIYQSYLNYIEMVQPEVPPKNENAWFDK